jgi:hypothetical protein
MSEISVLNTFGLYIFNKCFALKIMNFENVFSRKFIPFYIVKRLDKKYTQYKSRYSKNINLAHGCKLVMKDANFWIINQHT